MYEVVFLPAVVTEIICLWIRVRDRVRFRVNSFRDCVFVFLHIQHYSMLTTAGRKCHILKYNIVRQYN